MSAGNPQPVPLLRCHSEYSFTHGLLRLGGEQSMASIAARRGLWAVALTDTDNVCGAIEHCEDCLAHGIKPILGCHATFSLGGQRFRATLLCEDKNGFGNLSKILTRSHVESGGAIDAHSLDRDSTAGLIMLTGYEGDVCGALRRYDQALAAQRLSFWAAAFAEGGLCCELTFGGRAGESALTHLLAALAQQQGIPAVASHPSMFANETDFETHEVRTCIAERALLDNPERKSPYSKDQYVPEAGRFHELFAQLPQAVDNAQEIARRCNYDFGIGAEPQFPRIPGIGAGEEPDKLRELAEEGLAGITAGMDEDKTAAYRARLNEELGVITDKGFSGYFLIVADIVRHSRENGIPVGPGRGSGAGSMVAYALRITSIDPIEHGLLFERFLNRERFSLPDFDIDFCKDRRRDVIRYTQDAYGEGCVSQVITFGRLKAKAVVRDVCRVLGIPYLVGDAVSKLVPEVLNVTLEEAYGQVAELKGKIAASGELRRMWEFSLALEGIARQGSTHAAAVLISPRPLVEFCPLISVGDKDGHVVSQYDMKAAEKMGLIKFDFLGLKNLTMLAKGQQMVRRNRKDRDFDLDRIDLADKAMYGIYRDGNTAGVFQCESPGMSTLLKAIRPRSMDDIAVAVALYRPGPLSNDMDKIFVKNRTNRNLSNHFNKDIREILDQTSGALIYQEQVMRISQLVAGFSPGRADVLRAAMGKKDTALMDTLKKEFIDGCQAQMSKKQADELFATIERFAGYGFNKSHAICYAYLSLQTAYLKANHAAEFFASSLSTFTDDQKTQAKLLGDTRANDITLQAPCVNQSDVDFLPIDERRVMFGLASIRNVGRPFSEALIAERGKNGPFKDMYDLCLRTPLMNIRSLGTLIGSGACDQLARGGAGGRAVRASLARQAQQVLDEAARARSHANQESLFGDVVDDGRQSGLDGGPPWTLSSLLLNELDALGVTLSGRFSDQVGLVPGIARALKPVGLARNNDAGTWFGQPKRRISTAAARRDGSVSFTLESAEGECDVSADAGLLEGLQSRPDLLLVVSGSCLSRGEYPRPIIKADRVRPIDEWLANRISSVTVDATGDKTGHLDWILRFLEKTSRRQERGTARLLIKVDNGDGAAVVDTRKKTAPRLADLVTFSERLGQDAYSLALRG